MTVLLHTIPGSAKTRSKVKSHLQDFWPLDVQNLAEVKGRDGVIVDDVTDDIIDDDVTVDVIMHAKVSVRRVLFLVSIVDAL